MNIKHPAVISIGAFLAVCGQGEYVETSRTEIESIIEPVYQAVAVEAEPEDLAVE